jgi:hypothetical protein
LLPRSGGDAYVIEKIFAGDFVLSLGPDALSAWLNRIDSLTAVLNVKGVE